jgi:hypothetical protein
VFVGTAFKKGKPYKAEVVDSSNVDVNHEKLLGKSTTTFSKSDLIEKIKSNLKRDEEPCDLLDCKASKIERRGKEKSFADFLKNPLFENKKGSLTENKIKRKIRIILNC